MRYKTKQAWSTVVQQMRFLMNPDWEKNKNGEEKTIAVNTPSSGRNILHDYATILNQRHQILSKRKNKDQFGPTFVPGKYSQASKSIRWRVESTTSRDRVKGVLVNTPTFTWAYTRTFKERGKWEIRNSADVGSFYNAKGCFLSEQKYKIGYE